MEFESWSQSGLGLWHSEQGLEPEKDCWHLLVVDYRDSKLGALRFVTSYGTWMVRRGKVVACAVGAHHMAFGTGCQDVDLEVLQGCIDNHMAGSSWHTDQIDLAYRTYSVKTQVSHCS